MRKCFKALSLTLVLMMLVSVTVFAAETDPTVTPADNNTTAAFDSTFVKLESVTYANDAIVAGGQYMVFVVTANAEGEYIPTESSILYINQAQASEAGKITFSNVYPKTVADSAVMISGTGLAAPVVVATIEVPYMLGDVNGDDIITAADAQQIQRYAAGLSSVIEEDNLAYWLTRADVNADGNITAADAQQIQRYAAGLSSALD